MMVITAKVKKRNILIALGVIAALLLLLFRPGSKSRAVDAPAVQKADTNEQRIAYLESYGWTVESSPVETQEVRIPKEQNEIFQRYNELQKSQGYDLSQFAGKTAKRYVYAITNHPDGGNFYATVLVRDGQVIGGDVASTDMGGKMHGFAKPT